MELRYLRTTALFHLLNLALVLLSNSMTAYARCQRHFVRHTVTFNGCEHQLNSWQCTGNCEGTYAQPSPNDLMTISRNCECCMPSEFTWTTISCGDQNKRIRQITECRCRPCSVVTGVPESVAVRGRRDDASRRSARRSRRRSSLRS